jgi:hypothetical protein
MKQVNIEKTKYTFMSHEQKAGRNYSITVVNKCSENVVKFKFLGVTITNENCMHKKN